MIEIKNICKSFSGKKVLNNASMLIKDGETFSVIGPSGCGKSTLLKCIVRLIKPDSGEILVDGKNIVDIEDEIELAKVRKDFGYLFQGGALFDSLTVMENVTFGLKYLTDIPRKEYPRIAREKLALVGLEKAENLKPAELSGGMRKRVGLARAIIYEPQIVLYDEPTTGLDPIVSDSIDKLIIRVRDQLKVTSIVVTHDMRSARRVGNRVMMLHEKKLYANATPAEFFASTDPIVRQFVDGVADEKETLI